MLIGTKILILIFRWRNRYSMSAELQESFRYFPVQVLHMKISKIALPSERIPIFLFFVISLFEVVRQRCVYRENNYLCLLFSVKLIQFSFSLCWWVFANIYMFSTIRFARKHLFNWVDGKSLWIALSPTRYTFLFVFFASEGDMFRKWFFCF